jgi:HEAT repeat protein
MSRNLPEHERAPSGEEVSGPREAAPERIQPGASIHQSEWGTFAIHLRAEPTLRRPIAPAPDPPDPAPERARIEEELGIPELASSLAPFGTPPVAWPAEQTDRGALEHQLLSATKGVSRWSVAGRARRREAREEAARQAQAEDERLAAERRKLQQVFDNCWAELTALRHRAAEEVERWVDEELRRRKAAQLEHQAALDDEWRQLGDADPSSVIASLRAAFPNGTTTVLDGTTAVPDGTTTVLGFLHGVAVLVVACLDRDDVIADTEPASTRGRRRAVRARSETLRNGLYLAAIASRVLAGVGRALATTPAVEAVTCVAVRARASGTNPWEPIYVGTFERAYAERLLAEDRWSPDPHSLARAVEEAEEVDLELTESAREVAALHLSGNPGLTAVMHQMDPAVRSDEEAARESDQQAVKIFFSSADSARGADEERSEMQVAQGRDMSTAQEPRDDAGQETPSGAPRRPDESTGEPAIADLATDDGGAASGGDDDPLPGALKDRDGSVRRAAVEAMGRRNDPNDTRLLLEALSDRDENVRLEAMFALKDRLSPDMRRDALIKSCGASDETVRRNAIEALAELGDERDTPVLIEALRDRDDNVRLEAIYAVKHRLAPDMRDALIDACHDSDQRIRRTAVEALAQLDDERDTALLLTALRDSDSSVRLEAIYALEGRSALESSSHLAEPLLEAIKDEDANVRQAAVRLFGRLGQQSAPARSA